MKVFIVQSSAGVVEGVYTTEEKAKQAFSHWTHLELRQGNLDDLKTHPFDSYAKLVAALKGVCEKKLPDGTLCWCLADEEDPTHLDCCKQARAALKELGE